MTGIKTRFNAPVAGLGREGRRRRQIIVVAVSVVRCIMQRFTRLMVARVERLVCTSGIRVVFGRAELAHRLIAAERGRIEIRDRESLTAGYETRTAQHAALQSADRDLRREAG